LLRIKALLLKKKESLNEMEKEKLEQVGKVTPELIKMYQMKETFRDIFEKSPGGQLGQGASTFGRSSQIANKPLR
jgi:hypothetical protein